MEFRVAYCATHDRPVRIVVPSNAQGDAEGEGAVCMEHGDTCTGAMCPIFDVPSDEMREKLESYRVQMSEDEDTHSEGTP